jgi:DNA-binding NarL/FixJ family response regulator
VRRVSPCSTNLSCLDAFQRSVEVVALERSARELTDEEVQLLWAVRRGLEVDDLSHALGISDHEVRQRLEALATKLQSARWSTAKPA